MKQREKIDIEQLLKDRPQTQKEMIRILIQSQFPLTIKEIIQRSQYNYSPRDVIHAFRHSLKKFVSRKPYHPPKWALRKVQFLGKSYTTSLYLCKQCRRRMANITHIIQRHETSKIHQQNANRGTVLFKVHLQNLKTFNAALDHILQEDLRSTPNDLNDVQQLITKLTNIIHTDFHPDAQLNLFGSWASSLAQRKADIDLALTVPDHPINPTTIMFTLRKILINHSMKHVLALVDTRVPIVKFVYRYNEDNEKDGDVYLHRDDDHSRPIAFYARCDISLNNHLGVIKSEFIGDLCRIDSRLPNLIQLFKYWAKQNRISNARLGTFNSFCLVLLIIHFLQTVQPSILPPMSTFIDKAEVLKLLKWLDKHPGRTFRIDEFNLYNREAMKSYHGCGMTNKMNTGELFARMLYYFRYVCSFDSTISVYEGKLIKRDKSSWRKGEQTQITIEDPFVRETNVARNVSYQSLNRIIKTFERSYHRLIDTYDADLLFRRKDYKWHVVRHSRLNQASQKNEPAKQ